MPNTTRRSLALAIAKVSIKSVTNVCYEERHLLSPFRDVTALTSLFFRFGDSAMHLPLFAVPLGRPECLSRSTPRTHSDCFPYLVSSSQTMEVSDCQYYFYSCLASF